MKIASVSSVQAFDTGIIPGYRFAIINAEGTVPTSGWTHPRLVPFITWREPMPTDQIFDLDFVADEPSGMVLQVDLPVAAQIAVRLPDGTKGVRVHSAGGFIEEMFKSHTHPYVPQSTEVKVKYNL